MANAKDVLSADDYSNYRNVRAVAVLFIVLGSIFVLGGLGAAFGEQPRGKPRPGEEPVPVAFALGMAAAGLAGAIGGIAALRGNRRWAPLVYVMAVLYLFAFPIGTILSYVMLKGLSRYLDSKQMIAEAAVRTA